MYHGKRTVPWQLLGIRIGETALLSTQGEPFTEINGAIVATSPFRHTLFSGYSNHSFGYLPVRDAFEEGGYEVEASPFAPGAAEVRDTKAAALLRELARED